MSFEGKIAAPTGTDHKGPPSGRPAAAVAEPAGHAEPAGQQQHASGLAVASHEEEETALIAAGNRGWPSGALAVVEIASPLRPRE